MKQYLLSVYQPDGPPPPSVDLGKIDQELHRLNVEMKAAGAWVFTGKLHPPSTATVLRAQDGDVLMTDRPFVEGKEPARNRVIDRFRREASREDRHAQAALLHASGEPVEEGAVRDDRLRLIFACCHPALGTGGQVALR